MVATPVFRGSYTGLFKRFFDLIGQDTLTDKPVLLAATGGSQRHALVIDHQIRPLFSFFPGTYFAIRCLCHRQGLRGARPERPSIDRAGQADGSTGFALA
ncbi:NAD(P)H-dependent oxidoreductase [Aeromonas caviae]